MENENYTRKIVVRKRIKKKKKLLLISISAILIIVLALATSYALFNLNVTKNSNFKIAVGNLQLSFDDTENVKENGQLVLKDIEPLKETQALTKTPYKFKVTNTGKIDAGYSIYLDDVIPQGESRTRVANNLIWVNIKNVTTNTSQTYKLSEMTNRLLTTGLLNKNSYNNFELRVWLDYSATNTEQNKYIGLKLRIDSVQKNSLTLKEMILANNPVITAEPTLTTSSNNTNDASGLYAMNVTNGFGGQSAQGTTYYFRGNVNNNKVKFAGLDWRVIRINEDGTVRLILDGDTDGAAHVFNSNDVDYTYMYYSNSQAKTDVETWYNTNITGDNLNKVATGNYFCEAAKVKEMGYYTSVSATMQVPDQYVPDLVCQTDGNNKGLLNISVGLINYDEVVLAGGYYNKSNSSYYLYSSGYGWLTMSPAGLSGGDNTWHVLSSGYLIGYKVNNNINRLRPVINLKADVLATGSGTASDPYAVE